MALVDHFEFLDRVASRTKAKGTRSKPGSGSRQQEAEQAGWFLSTDDRWTAKYFDKGDLKCVDRELFG